MFKTCPMFVQTRMSLQIKLAAWRNGSARSSYSLTTIWWETEVGGSSPLVVDEVFAHEFLILFLFAIIFAFINTLLSKGFGWWLRVGPVSYDVGWPSRH